MVSGTYFYFQWQPLERKHTKSKDNYTFGKVYIQVKFKHTYVQVYIQVKFKKELYYCKKKKKQINSLPEWALSLERFPTYLKANKSYLIKSVLTGYFNGQLKFTDTLIAVKWVCKLIQ